jgi:hypothetical protein
MDNTAIPDESTGQTVVKLSGAADIVGMLPHRLGFHPHESLVAISLKGPRKRDQVVMRADLPSRADESAFAEQIAGQLHRLDSDGAVLVCYTDEPPPIRSLQRARLIRQLKGRCKQLGIELVDALLVHDGRWWSYLCDNPDCCPPDGAVLQSELTPAALQFAAETVARGGVVRESRDSLAASIEALPEVADQDDEEDHVDLDAYEGYGSDEEWWTNVACSSAVPPIVGLVECLWDRWVHGDCTVSDLDARLITRELWAVMARMHCLTLVLDGDPPDRSVLVALFAELARRTPDRLAGPVCSLLGWYAQAAGDGALALVAAERSSRCQPDNTIAAIVLGNARDAMRPAHVLDSAARIRDTLTQLATDGGRRECADGAA